MWLDLLTTVSAAALAAGLSIPATRKIILGDVSQDWLQSELELDCIDEDRTTVLTKDGRFSHVYEVAGINYDAKEEDIQRTMLIARSNLFHQLGTKRVDIRIFGIKRKSDLNYDAEWPCCTLEEIAEAEKKIYRHSFSIKWIVLLTSKDRRALSEGREILLATLSNYYPRQYKQPENRNDPCELTCFLNYLISGELRDDFAVISKNLSGTLPGSDLAFEKDGLVTTQVPTRKVQKIVSIREWPESSSGQMIQELMAIPGDIEVVQIVLAQDRDTTLAWLTRQEREQKNSFFKNSAALQETQDIMELLNAGSDSLFQTQFHVVVRADTEDQLDELLKQVSSKLGPRRINYCVETVGAPICWFNRLPGQDKLLRPLKLLNMPVASIWPFHYSSVGQPASPYGSKPVRLLRTRSGQAYSFQFHLREQKQSLGHYLVIAPSGSGKSTLLMHLLSGLAKFDGVRSYIFDSNEGARFMIEALGGLYQGYEELALNFLDIGEQSKANEQRVFQMMKSMLGEKFEFTDEANEELEYAARTAFRVDPPDRTFNHLFPHAFAQDSTVRKALRRWVIDEKGQEGLYHHLFNAPHDSLTGTLSRSHMFGINMNEALNDPDLGPPVVAHISAAIRKAARSNNKGFNIFIDEAANLLQNDGFKDIAKEMFREYRKLDGCVGMAFQDPAALQRSGIAEAIIDNVATLIFFPNAMASQENLAPFKLNEEQINFITGASNMDATGNARSGRQVLIVKREASTGYEESAIVDIDLSPLGEPLRFYRAGDEANNYLAAHKRKWGDQWLQSL